MEINKMAINTFEKLIKQNTNEIEFSNVFNLIENCHKCWFDEGYSIDFGFVFYRFELNNDNKKIALFIDDHETETKQYIGSFPYPNLDICITNNEIADYICRKSAISLKMFIANSNMPFLRTMICLPTLKNKI